MKEILTLPHQAEQVIYEYTHLALGGKQIVCPYLINIRKERVGLRVLVGKGDPGEIVKEVKVWAKLKDLDLEKANSDQIRRFMLERSIGIDCSGFIVHVFGYWLKSVKHKHLQDYLIFKRNDPLSILRRLLRPVENIGANTLTGLDNCEPVTDLNKVLPGDFIRSKGKIKNSHHIMLVRRVTRVAKKVTEIEYVHSSRYYENNNGVRFGIIKITDPEKPLEKQEWLEVLNGRNYTLETYLNQVEDNGIRRLKRVQLKYEILAVE